MCTASTMTPVMIALVTSLSPRYGTEQIVWARQVSQLLVLSIAFGPRLGTGVLRTPLLRWQILRSTLLLASSLLLYAGAQLLPLAKSTSLNLTGPLFVGLLAWPLLGERPTWPRMLAIGIGLSGALLIARPTGAIFHPAAFLILGAALCFALFQILTRFVGRRDRPETSAVYSVLVGAIALSLFVPFAWSPIQGAADLSLMLLLGVLGALGHYCLARALVHAPANLVAPFIYWQLVGAIVIGYIASGEIPDRPTAIGAALIVGAGLVLGWRETRERHG